MKTILFLCGLYSIAFAIFHLFFWRIFNWKSELEKISKVNRGITQILNTRIIFIFLFVAFICFKFPVELVSTSLGKVFLAGMSLFWLGRTIEQFVFLKGVESKYVHVLTLVFVLGTILFALPLVCEL